MQISAPAFSAGVAAIQAGQAQLSSATQAIAQPSNYGASSPATTAIPILDSIQLSEQLMRLEQAKLISELGVRVLLTAEESLGSLIDIQA